MSGHRYGAPAMALHWAIALLIFAGFALGLYMTELPLSPQKLKLYAYHKWIGVTVFGLALVRIAWRLTHPAPPQADSLPAWQSKAAHAVHGALYLLLVAMPVSGWLYSSAVGVPTVYLGVWQLPDLVSRNRDVADALKLVHNGLGIVLAAFVAVHVGAALKHQFIDRDGVLARMVPFLRPRPGVRS